MTIKELEQLEKLLKKAKGDINFPIIALRQVTISTKFYKEHLEDIDAM